jgi:hypothetical protein
LSINASLGAPSLEPAQTPRSPRRISSSCSAALICASKCLRVSPIAA